MTYTAQEKADILKAYNDYLAREFDDAPLDKIPDNLSLPLLYTYADEAETKEMQVSAELGSGEYVWVINGFPVHYESFDDAEALVSDLTWCGSGDFMSY